MQQRWGNEVKELMRRASEWLVKIPLHLISGWFGLTGDKPAIHLNFITWVYRPTQYVLLANQHRIL